MDTVLEFVSFFFLAVFCEGLVEYSLVEVLKRFAKRTWYVRYISLALGIVVAHAYQVSLPSRFGLEAISPLVDFTVTGLILGRGANYLSDIIGQLRGSRNGGTAI